MPSSKVFPSAYDALADLSSGATIMVGGCAAAGVPQRLLRAVARRGANGITCIGEAHHEGDTGQYSLSALVAADQVQKLVTTPPPTSSWVEAVLQRMLQGSLEVEVTPSGILAERIRAGGAGVGGFLVQPQANPAIDVGKERQVLDGVEYVLETPLRADFALLWAHKADTLGNLVYRGAGRNWNPVMATAAAIVIVEVDEVVEPGDLDPELMITQGIFVDRIVASEGLNYGD